MVYFYPYRIFYSMNHAKILDAFARFFHQKPVKYQNIIR